MVSAADVDVLIPAYNRPCALAITLTALIAQTCHSLRVVISDQTEDRPLAEAGEVAAIARILRALGRSVGFHRHVPRRGMAEQRQFLLDQATAPFVLYLDDDVVLEPDAIERMLTAIREEGCGFVGMALHGLSRVSDVRPHQQDIEFWDGPVQPEVVLPGSVQWARHRLHNAANLWHVQQRLDITPDRQRKYKVAWVGGCCMYDTARLREVGGFNFWPQLPPDHCGEDVLAQQRVMARYGGCALIPSGAYHLELPTTIPDRTCNAPELLHLTGLSAGC